jgi:hypothetical protein
VFAREGIKLRPLRASLLGDDIALVYPVAVPCKWIRRQVDPMIMIPRGDLFRRIAAGVSVTGVFRQGLSSSQRIQRVFEFGDGLKQKDHASFHLLAPLQGARYRRQ